MKDVKVKRQEAEARQAKHNALSAWEKLQKLNQRGCGGCKEAETYRKQLEEERV